MKNSLHRQPCLQNMRKVAYRLFWFTFKTEWRLNSILVDFPQKFRVLLHKLMETGNFVFSTLRNILNVICLTGWLLKKEVKTHYYLILIKKLVLTSLLPCWGCPLVNSITSLSFVKPRCNYVRYWHRSIITVGPWFEYHYRHSGMSSSDKTMSKWPTKYPWFS